ncbi:MAG: polysaccharide biosynthesis/export family protein [Acidobacteria bacterium]|nr:polysaccharide biosynthesis/export family protein [Acidobacteriota bacterium]
MKRLLLALMLLVASAGPLPAQNDYVVGPQDVLTVTVFGEAELSGKYTVEQDGTFTFPQIGRVKAGGLTLRNLEQELKTKLADGYLKNPQVAVAIENYRSQRILVMGEVRSPGEFQLNGEMTLLAALARAGSTTPAAAREVTVVRARKNPAPGDDPSEVIKVDLLALQAGNTALNIPLQDGDTVNVPKAQSVFVAGQVKTPGAYAVDPGTTVLQVISLAGGLTDRGSDNRIRIQRSVNGKKLEVSAKLSDLVQPGDTIIVRERFF